MKAVPTISVWFESNKAYASGHIKSEMGKHILSILYTSQMVALECWRDFSTNLKYSDIFLS